MASAITSRHLAISPHGHYQPKKTAPEERVSHVHHIPKKLRKKVDHLKRARQVILHPDNPIWLHSLGGEARSIMGVAKPFFKIHEIARRVIASTQFTTAFTMPFDIFNLIMDVRGLAVEHGKRARLDNALSVVGDVSQIVDGAMTFSSALVDLEAIAPSMMDWIGPLALSAALASGVFFAIHGRGIYYCNRLLKKLKKITPQQLPGLIKKQAYRLSRYADIDTDALAQTVNQILKHPTAANEEKEKRLAQVSAALKKRIQHKRISHVLGILVTAVGLIASVILFATALTGWGIAASVLLGVSFALSMGKIGFTIYMHQKFKKSCALAVEGALPQKSLEKPMRALREVTN